MTLSALKRMVGELSRLHKQAVQHSVTGDLSLEAMTARYDFGERISCYFTQELVRYLRKAKKGVYSFTWAGNGYSADRVNCERTTGDVSNHMLANLFMVADINDPGTSVEEVWIQIIRAFKMSFVYTICEDPDGRLEAFNAYATRKVKDSVEWKSGIRSFVEDEVMKLFTGHDAMLIWWVQWEFKRDLLEEYFEFPDPAPKAKPKAKSSTAKTL